MTAKQHGILSVGLGVLWILGAIDTSPIPAGKHDENHLPVAKNAIPPTEAFKFMQKFGYLEQGIDGSEALYSEDAVVNAIKNVQKFGAIPMTGVIDKATVKLMNTPRCGVHDLSRQQRLNNTRQKRFTLGSSGWNKRNLTFFVSNWSPKLGEQKVVEEIQKALNIWGSYGLLNFKPIRDPTADIIVTFGRGYHGDEYSFDGPGGVLAHAFYPYEGDSTGGDIHFDDDESWTTDLNNNGGTDFFTVALHELGHSLGIAHSYVQSSIMFPYYKGERSEHIDYDDILAMHKLYIERRLPEDDHPVTESVYEHRPRYTPTSPHTHRPYFTTPRIPEVTNGYDSVPQEPEIVTKGQSIPDICHGDFDAVAHLRGEFFIFKGEYLWRLNKRGILEHGYPVLFRQMFVNLPESVKKIDAAYERSDGIIILFTGKQFWVYDGYRFIEGSPRPITDYGLPSYLDKIDAVQIWAKNKKTYIYRGNRFWRYNETTKTMDAGYPMSMTRWFGVPNDLDAAVTDVDDGVTYFFKGSLYWTFNNARVRVEESSPLPAPQVWLGCPERLNTYYG